MGRQSQILIEVTCAPTPARSGRSSASSDDRPALSTFATKREAEIWLSKKEIEIQEGDWSNPNLGKITFKVYGSDWIDERPGLRPKTVQLYKGLLRLHLIPTCGNQAGTCQALRTFNTHVNRVEVITYKELIDNARRSLGDL